MLFPVFGGCLTALIFALHYIIAKLVIDNGATIYSLAAWRGLIGGSLLFFIFYKKVNISEFKAKKWSLLLISFLGFFLNQIFFMKGLQYTTPLYVALLSNTIPVASLFFAILYKLEKFHIKKISGIAISFSVIAYLILSSSQPTSGSNPDLLWGNTLVFINVLFFSFALVHGKKLINQGFPFEILTATMLFVGGLMMSFFSNDLFSLFRIINNLNFLLMVLFEIIVSSGLVYLLNLWCVKKMGVTKTNFFIFLQPIITSIIQIMTKNQWPTYSHLVAFVGLFLGAYLIFKVKES